MSFQANPVSDSNLPLFVYGTLRRGQPYYGFIRGYTLQETSATATGYLLYASEDYPFAIQGKGTIVGELIWLHPQLYCQLLDKLDRIEGCHPEANTGKFRRVTCTVRNANQQNVTAWMYLGNPDFIDENSIHIPHGDWTRFRMEQFKKTRTMNYRSRHDKD